MIYAYSGRVESRIKSATTAVTALNLPIACYAPAPQAGDGADDGASLGSAEDPLDDKGVIELAGVKTEFCIPSASG